MTDNKTNLVEIVVNGETRSVPAGLNIYSLLKHLGIDASRVAVELNREIVRKPAWEGTAISAGAQLEIVHFVGGG